MRRVLFSLAVVMMVLAVAGPASAQWRGMGRLTGKVVDDGGAPVANIAVKAEFAQGGTTEIKTDDKGKFILAGIAKGEWVLTFAQAGMITVKYKTEVREMAVMPEVNVTLKKRS